MLLAELLWLLPEIATQFTYENGDMPEYYYRSAANNFEAALKFMAIHELLPQFEERAKKTVEQTSDCGWGFKDDMEDIYFKYYPSHE